jgi:predicted alpha/beta-hydrolase family hydrolase
MVYFDGEKDVPEPQGLIRKPANARALFVFAHGAGADRRHAFMEGMAQRLETRAIATFRYDFPYMTQRRRRPDPAAVLESTVRAAVGEAHEAIPDIPLFAGGKSMGGRMTSSAAAKEPLNGVRGLVFLGFPLHPPGRVDTRRADHLKDVHLPMLFVQGTRDALADLERIREVCVALGERATLHVVEGGDHSFKVLKRSGRDGESVMDEIADVVSQWVQRYS